MADFAARLAALTYRARCGFGLTVVDDGGTGKGGPAADGPPFCVDLTGSRSSQPPAVRLVSGGRSGRGCDRCGLHCWDLLLHRASDPHEAEAGEDEHEADACEQTGDPECHLERRCRGGADTQLTDKRQWHGRPGQTTHCRVDRVRKVEVGVVTAVDRNLVTGVGDDVAVRIR